MSPSLARSDPRWVLTLDVGTSSVRAIVFDSGGRAMRGLSAQNPYSFRTTRDGGVEMDVEELLGWVVEAIDRVIGRAGGRARRIAAVGVSTFWHNVIGITAQGRPATPIYSWADTRPQQVAQRLRERLNERRVQARTGCLLHASYLPAKLLWLSEAHPRRFERSARWMSFGEYLLFRFLGQATCSLSMASGSGLFHQKEKRWDEEILQVLPVSAEQLSPLVDLGNSLHGLRREWARRWPVLDGVPWFPALGDGACSNIGSGCSSQDRVALMVGTSGALRVLWKGAPAEPPPGLWSYRADSRRVLMGGALSNGGSLIAWMEQVFRLGSRAARMRQLTRMAPDSHGLTVLPFLAGERSTGWHGEARGTVAGLSLNTNPYHILQAGMEAVAFRFRSIYDRLNRVLGKTEEVIASGGALRYEHAWRQMIADVLERPVILSSEAEPSSRGVALLVLEALGILPDVASAPAALGRVYLPRPEASEIYRVAFSRQNALYEKLIV